MVATASTEHSYWLALAFVAWTQALAFLVVFVYATHATQATAFVEWKPGLTLTWQQQWWISTRTDSGSIFAVDTVNNMSQIRTSQELAFLMWMPKVQFKPFELFWLIWTLSAVCGDLASVSIILYNIILYYVYTILIIYSLWANLEFPSIVPKLKLTHFTMQINRHKPTNRRITRESNKRRSAASILVEK